MHDSDQRLPGLLDALRLWRRRWQACDVALFGSILTDDFGPDSDVDLLASFSPNGPQRFGSWGHDLAADDLARAIGRPVDLLTWHDLRRMPNPFRRVAILEHHRPIDAA